MCNFVEGCSCIVQHEFELVLGYKSWPHLEDDSCSVLQNNGTALAYDMVKPCILKLHKYAVLAA